MICWLSIIVTMETDALSVVLAFALKIQIS